MERLRWRFRFRNGRPVRVLQYWSPGTEWRDLLVTPAKDDTPEPSFAPAAGRAAPGADARAMAQVIDLDDYRRRRGS